MDCHNFDKIETVGSGYQPTYGNDQEWSMSHSEVEVTPRVFPEGGHIFN